MSPAENLTGDEPLGRALANLPETTSTRVKQLVHALNEIFIELPAEERVAATIRLDDRRDRFAGVPIDHYLFEWMPPIDAKTADESRLHIEVKPAGAGGGSPRQAVTVRVTRDKKRLIVTTTLLVGTAAESCERVLQEAEVLAGTNVSLVPIVDTVASCIVMHHLRERLSYMARFTKMPSGALQRVVSPIKHIRQPRLQQATHFVSVFDPLLALGDSARQRELLVGIERYDFYAKNWMKQPGDAKTALEEAVTRIHQAVGGDDADARAPRYPLAEYLYVHAGTTLLMGQPEPSGRPTERRDLREHLSLHVDRAFRVWPYECARWAKAVALQAVGRPAEAQTAWRAVGDKPTARCAPSEEQAQKDNRDARRRRLAKARIAAVYSAIGNPVKALKIRVQDAQAPATAAAAGPPASSAARPATSGAASASASPPAATGGGDRTPALENAAELFESALDSVQLYHHAASVREMLPVTKGVVRFVEEDMVTVRDAVAPIQAIAPKESTELAKAREGLDNALAQCRTASRDCDALRDAARAFVERLMQSTNDVAVQQLTDAARLLEAERDRLCRNEAAKLSECEGTIAGSAAPAADDEDEGEDRQRADARVLLRQVSDTWVRVLMMLVYQECHAPKWVAPARIDLDAADVAKRTEDVLRRSPLAPAMAALVGDCALTAAAASTPAGEELIKTHRGTHAAEAWPWSPPPAEGAFRIEKELRDRDLDDFPQAHPAMALFRYATLWDAVSAYASVRAESPSKDLYSDAANAAIRAYVSHEAWTPKRDLLSLWDSEIGDASVLRKAMGAVGSALYREFQRKQHEALPISCLDVLALRTCDKSVPPRDTDAPEECASAGSPACLIDDARSSHEEWAGTKQRPDSIPGVQSSMHESYRRAAGDRLRFFRLLDAGMKVLLTRFAAEAKDGLDDERVRLATLRIAARLRSLPEGVLPAEPSLLGLAAFDKLVAKATTPEQVQKTRMLAVASAEDPLRALAGHGIGQCQDSCRIDAISERAIPSFAGQRWSRPAAAG
jgi:hypothetical protein